MSERREQLIEWLLAQPEPESNAAWQDYLALGISPADEPLLLDILREEDLFVMQGQAYMPLHCWRALGQLCSKAAIKPLLALQSFLEGDDWLELDFPIIAGMIGPEVIPLLADGIKDVGHHHYTHTLCINAIAKLGSQYPQHQRECVHLLHTQLALFANDGEDDEAVNGLLVSSLLDLQAVDSYPLIKQAFELNIVDWSICGDLEEVEIELGLRDKRSTPRRLHPRYALVQQQLAQWTANQRSATPAASQKKIGRNDPCPCGSGKKYKKCCLH